MDKTSKPTGIVSEDAVRKCLPSFNQREDSAFDEIYRLYYDMVWNYLSSRVRDHASKEDILQDSFIAVWESKKKKFKKPLDLQKYLIRIVRNKYADHIKRLKKQRPASNDNTPSDTSSDKKLLSADDHLRNQFIHRIIDGFSSIRKAAIIGKFFNGQSDEQIAAEYGVNKDRIRSERFKGLRILGKRLGQEL